NADNLVAGDTPGSIDAFRKNVATGEIDLVNATAAGVVSNYIVEGVPAVSDDGRYVVFATGATNLDASDDNGTTDVYRKDLTTGAILLVSTNASGTVGNSNSSGPAISGDG